MSQNITDTPYTLFINGQAVEAPDHFEVINPATEALVAECPIATVDDLNAAVEAARKAFPQWGKASHEERQDALRKIADHIEEQAEALARLIVLEQGKPFPLAMDEVMGGVAWTRYAAEQEVPVELIEDSDEKRVELHRRPLGVVASITPWNWPFMIAIWHIMPALRAGNTVISKPSQQTPLSTIKLVEIINQHVPAGVINVVTAKRALGSAISEHKDINKIVFTGSTPIGQSILRNSADNLKRLTLELGGNDAGIILPGSDIEAIAGDVFAAAFLNMGQTCAALKRLYVHSSQYQQMCQALVDIAGKQAIGDGLEQGVDFGPVQNADQLETVIELVDDARGQGANVLCGGSRLDQKGYFYPPTIVADISNDARLVQEEQFGPALPVIEYNDVDQALQWANANESGLGGSVWASDSAEAEAMAAQLESGVAWVNCHARIDPHTPFGGWKMSGVGLEFGLEGLLQFTNQQLVYKTK